MPNDNANGMVKVVANEVLERARCTDSSYWVLIYGLLYCMVWCFVV